jgi:hypothetical protein
MLGEILPDLMLLAIVLAFILSRDAGLTAAGRALGLATVSQRSQRIAAITGLRQRLSRASALATPAERATHVESASRILHDVERGTPSVALHQARAHSTALPPTPEEMPHGQP